MPLTFQTKIGIGLVVLVVAAVVVACVVLALNKNDSSDKIETRLECAVTQTNQKACEEAGCSWHSDTPQCVLPKNSFGFVFEKETSKNLIELKVKKGSFFGKDFQKVKMTIKNVNKNVLRIKFEDEGSRRYQVPVHLNLREDNLDESKLEYETKVEKDPKAIFSFSVTRRATGTTIFDSSVGSLFLADRHIEITTKLPTENVYGIGENTHTSFKHDLNYRKWPLFSRDQFPDPSLGRLNLYGVHPFYTCLEENGRSHGVLFFNSDPMEVMFTPMPSLTYRTAGGILDMLFFVGDSPEHVVQLYTEVIGRPMIPPYWSLGFQLSRFGFNIIENLAGAIKRTKEKKIPLDVVHADIDHMEENKDFTWDKKRFPDFPQFIQQQQSEGLRVIIILDPALLANDPSYKQYADGEAEDVYIKWPNDIPVNSRSNPPEVNKAKDIIFGKVWPNGPVAFPDFFKTSTKTWWMKNIKEYRKELNFDAIWIDMNEPAAFGTDAVEPWYCKTKENCWTLRCPDNDYDSFNNTFIPAAVSAHKGVTSLADKTLCMAAVQGENQEYRHYDVHSLYGWSQSESTYKALQDSATGDQVPLVISRSTYPSSGRYVGHWLGDNKSSWDDLRNSIIGMLEFNLFGIPYIGADICGFFQNTTSELCGRWMQAGAFYPFSRNHNNKDEVDQDPGNENLMLPEDTKRAKEALDTRYRLLPYLHTLHYLAHLNGNTVVRPLFHEFPTDSETYAIQEQFLWGPSLLISPALYQNQTKIRMYLPGDTWYDFYQGSTVGSEKAGQWIEITNTNVVPLHVRGGHILPMKAAGALNTKESRTKDFEIHAYIKNDQAKGFLFWMSEQATDARNKDSYNTYSFELKENQLIISSTSTGKLVKDGMTIGSIFVYGLSSSPKKVNYEGTDLEKMFYDTTQKILRIDHRVDLLQIQDQTSTKFQWSY